MENQAHSLYDLYDNLITLAWYFSSHCCTGCDSQDLDMPDLNMVDFLALRLIHKHDRCPVQTIGKALGMTKSGATRVARRLEKKGLLDITGSHEDGRVRCLQLTRNGQECMARITHSQAEQLQKHLDSMGAQNSRQLINGLTSLMQNLDVLKSLS